MATKLKRIVLEFDDGTSHEVEDGYHAVYKNAGRAKKANEKEPWKKPPKHDPGKDDGETNGDEGSGCYIINGAIVCP